MALERRRLSTESVYEPRRQAIAQMTHPAPSTLQLYADVGFSLPTPEDVRAVIRILDMTADQVADIVGVRNGRAVRRWLAPKDSKTHAQIDYATWRLLLLEAGLVRQPKRKRPGSKQPRRSRPSESGKTAPPVKLENIEE